MQSNGESNNKVDCRASGEGQENSLHRLFAADDHRELLLSELRRYNMKTKLSLLKQKNIQGNHSLELSTPENLAAFFNAEDLWRDVAIELTPPKCSGNFLFLLFCLSLYQQAVRCNHHLKIKFDALLVIHNKYAKTMHQHLDFYKICLLMHLAPNISTSSHDRILDEQTYRRGKQLL